MQGIKQRLERGLKFVESVVGAGVEEGKEYVARIGQLIYEGGLKEGAGGTALVKKEAFEAYLVSAIDKLEGSFFVWDGLTYCRRCQTSFRGG